MTPIKYVTEAEVLVLMNKSFENYEATVGRIRHGENTKNFETLFAAFNKMRGAIWAVGSIFTLLMAGLEIYRISHR